MTDELLLIVPQDLGHIQALMKKYFFKRGTILALNCFFLSESGDSAPLPSELADAGFYYTGQADRVKCFQCGLILHSWEPMGLPWHAHAK